VSRAAVAGAKRLVVKVGSSSLASAAGGLDAAALDRLAEAFAKRAAAGTRVVVVSSGAIAAGLAPLGLGRRPRDLATQQAAASVGQGALVARWAEALGRRGITVGQVLLTADDVVRRSHWRNAQRTFERLLGLGVIPIVNENDTVATEEIRFGDNDRLAALVTHLVRADALVLLSDVDGVHSTDPALGAGRRISEVSDPAQIADAAITAPVPGGLGLGRGGMVTKVAAARIAAGAGVPTLLAAAADAEAALSGSDVGTIFHPTGGRVPARLLWLAHATEPHGRLHLDAGAVDAVVGRRSSLLAAGVTAVDGSFTAGDAVDLVDPAGTAVARGLVGYDADELPALLGRRTDDLVATLGPAYSREVVHRDDLALL
jgi:glutamate 5-kinase